MRACEIRGLQWQHIDFIANTVQITRSKTKAGHRTPSLNSVCKEALRNLQQKAELIRATKPEHYMFPWHGREQRIDPTKPITSWRSAWRSILQTAGVKARFHDLRRCAVTVMAEKGLPDATIMAQVGTVSPEMMRHYSHIRRQALNTAAEALEPSYLRRPASVDEVELIN